LIFSYALGKDALPLLKELSLFGDWETGAFPMLLRGLSEGACPRLEVIDHLPIPFRGHNAFDRCETREVVKALVEMLEKRCALGTCAGLKKLDGMWFDWTSPSDCIRILRAVLPTLEELPELETWDFVVAREFYAIGGPYLKALDVMLEDDLYALASKPEAFMRLQTLYLVVHNEDDHPTSEPAIRSFSAALAQGAWPQLRCLSVQDGDLGEGRQVLIGALIKRHGIRGGLEEFHFSVELTDKDVDALAEAFSKGCFTQLKKLSLAHNRTVTDLGAARLAKVLQHAPLLESLELNSTGMRNEGCRAVAHAVASHCPAMKKLVFPREIGDEGLIKVQRTLRAANRGTTLTASYWW
jgi:hypothetical protein